MKRNRGRTTFAPKHRKATAPRKTSNQKVYQTDAGQGILRQTLPGTYSEPVVEAYSQEHKITYYLVESGFPGRFYALRRLPSGAWHFSGEQKLREQYVARVEAFIAAKQCREVA